LQGIIWQRGEGTMSGQRRLGRRELATMAAATVPLGAAAFAQSAVVAAPAFQATPLPQPVVPMVDVTGNGVVRVAPDMATVVIGVEAQRSTLAEAQD
jgi:uncharacterized protein YggE